MSFSNTYDDPRRAAAYATLAFPGTYHLAFRDLPTLLGPSWPEARALDFGCGAGRSTRFLAGLGYRAEGVDISEAMLEQARATDPEGIYLRVPDGDLGRLEAARYDRILSAFTFDNVPMATKPALFGHLGRILKPGGRLLNLVSSEALYGRDWASFLTAHFPENRAPRTGDPVFTVMKDIPDARPIPDIFCAEADYLALYAEAGLRRVHSHAPLGRAEEPYTWVSEREVAPWRIDVIIHEEAPPLRLGQAEWMPGCCMRWHGAQT